MKKIMEDVPWARYDGRDGFAGFLGDLKKNKRRLNDWLHEVSLDLPVSKMFGLKIDFRQTWLLIRDPAGVKHILKDSFATYTKVDSSSSPLVPILRRFVGDGIFLLRHGVGAPDGGSAWQRQRKLASLIFTKANFQSNMGEVFEEKAQRLCALLAEPAREGRLVDMQKLFFSFTMDSIMQIFFGEAANTLGGEGCVYSDAFDAAHRSMMEYVRPSTAALILLSYLPWPLGGFDGLAAKLHGALSPDYRSFNRAVRTLDRESMRLVKKCLADPALSERKDLLALFAQAADKDFTPKYLKDMVLQSVLAGRDTTACALSWMFFVLASNPDVQKKLQAEIDKKLPSGTTPSFKSLAASEMPYLNGVLYEVLRLYPPVPLNSKVAHEDDVLPSGDRVAKGAVCFYLPYAMGRDPKTYPEPEVVRPERWIPFTPPAPHEFPVFQAGPRICLGMEMAIFEAKLAAAMLLQRYSFSISPAEREKIHYVNTLTMAISNSKNQDSHNLWLKPQPRAQA